MSEEFEGFGEEFEVLRGGLVNALERLDEELNE